jgi:hypothetical protein
MLATLSVTSQIVRSFHYLSELSLMGLGFVVVYDWPSGFAFILSFMAPVWTICAHFFLVSSNSCLQKVIYIIGSFDSTVHISEEASNAATAVPWAIVWATSIAGISGLGTPSII